MGHRRPGGRCPAAGRRPRPARRPLKAALACAIVLLFIAGCGGSESAEGGALPATPLPADQDPGPVHVHGLGVNPADARVYVATHFGLWRLTDGGAERVGEAAYDLMGFTVVGPDHFLASGHPQPTDDLPPLLGLVESTDGGERWRSVDLLGQADFHALRVAGDAVWGWNSSDGALMVRDAQGSWERRATVTSLLDAVVDPADGEHLLATRAGATDTTDLLASDDGGRTWEALDGPPLARLSWEEAGRLWGVGLDGTVWRGGDGGESWERTGNVGGQPAAFADAGDRLLVAVGDRIVQSSDGVTWTDVGP